MNKKIVVVGSGNMGRSIAWALESLGYDLIVLDQNQQSLLSCKKLLQNKKNHRFSRFDCDTHYGHINTAAFNIIKGSAAVISSLPYHKNLLLAQQCVAYNIPYFDLGGHINTSKHIHELTTAKKGIAFTDLGLAPGWANIIAEELCDELESQGQQPKEVQIMVGGLPVNPTNTLQYACTWSFDGLVNEYKDDCIVLKDNLISVASGMSGLESIDSSIGPLEAFYTSGGVAHSISSMLKRGVPTCCYKTLRYPGHNKIVKFLIHESGLTDEEIIKVFKHTCPAQEDLVIIKVLVNDLLFEQVIHSDVKFSAMQKATGFPVASAVHTVLLSDQYSGVLKYSDLDHSEFNKNLKFLLKSAISE